MKAIIMAGGEGSRLRPLTCDCPKPMMRLMDKPVMQYALELLRSHGITEIAATLGYLPDAIPDYFGDGTNFGVSLRYYIEKTPLGTAGGVAQARDFLDETFIVLSGDGVTDLDITRVLEFHREKHALATLVLKHEENPCEYGVVSTAEDGLIDGFYEKPGRCDVLSDTVNTGIYILEPEVLALIPAEAVFDFGSDLFPALVRERARIFGYITEDYWCDIGDVQAYLGAHRAAMDGKIRLPGLLPCSNGIMVMPGATIDPSAVLEPPCLIASGAQIHPQARIGAYSVVGQNCIVGECASLKRTVMWSSAQLAPHSQARGCVLAAQSELGTASQAFEECVLGSNASVGERTILASGVKLWPGKCTGDGERVESNLVWGSQRAECFVAGCLKLSSPARATRIAQAFTSAIQPKELLLGRGTSTVSSALWHAVAAGAMSQGVQVIDAGISTLPQLRHALRAMRTDSAALVWDDRLIPLCPNGARIPSRQQRTVNMMNARQDYAEPFTGITLPIMDGGRTEIGYIADASACFSARPEDAPCVAVHAQSPHLLSLAERIFARAGLRIRAGWEEDMMELSPDEVGIRLDEHGETAVLSDSTGALSEAEQQMMLAWIALECGERELLLPMAATRAIRILAENFGARASYVSGDISVWMEQLAQRHPFQFTLWFDGIQYALHALSLLVENDISLEQWRRSLPEIHRRSRCVDVPVSQTGRVLHAFAERERKVELGGGVRFLRDNGWGWVSPDEQKAQFHIVTESVNAEFARELCDFCESELKKMLAEEHPES